MCREAESIRKVNHAADKLAEACRNICRDDVSAALHSAYDSVVSEGVKPDEQRLLDRLQ